MADKKTATTLSPASVYEQTFRTRHRRVGRPDGSSEPLFGAGGAHPLVAQLAQRRAFAVVHEEQRERLAEVFKAELKVLGRRDVAEVAEDAGVDLTAWNKRNKREAR